MALAVSGMAAPGVRIARGTAVIALIFAVVAFGVLAAGPLGWRAGWWSYSVGLGLLLPAAFIAGLGGAGLGLVALVAGRFRRSLAPAIAAIVIGAGTAAVPWHFAQLRGQYPPIDDIATDTANPPPFVAAVPLRKAEAGNTSVYGGEATAALQRKAYPDLAPLDLKLPPAAAYSRALATVDAMGWAVTASDPAAGTLEAYDRSRWFGFIDDISIRVTATEGGSRIDIRSASRHGRGDFGVNAARIRKYLAALKADAAAR